MPKEKLVEPKAEPAANPQKILDLASGYGPAMALAAAIELDLFTAVGQGANTVPELARQLGLSARGVAILLDALAGIGLLDKQNGRYALATDAEAYLVKGKDTYLGGYVEVARALEPQQELLAVAARLEDLDLAGAADVDARRLLALVEDHLARPEAVGDAHLLPFLL